MSRLGADPDALRDLATGLRRAAGTVDRTAADLERRVRLTGWRGRDADGFTGDWQRRHRPALVHVAAQFRDAAQRLDRQAEEQVRTSSGPSGPSSAALPSSSHTSSDTAGPPAPARAAREEVQLRAGTEVVAAGLVIGMRQDLSIRRLDGHRSLLTTTDTDRGGVAATFGASAGLRTGGADGSGGAGGGGTAGHDRLLATQSTTRLTVARVTRQQYLVDDEDVGPTVVRLGAETAVDALGDSLRQVPVVGLAAAAWEPAVAAWDWIADHVADRVAADPLDLGTTVDRLGIAPEPDRVEQLSEVAVAGSVGVALASTFGLDAGTELSGSIRMGTSIVDGRRASSILEADGSVAAVLQGTLVERLGIDVPGRRGLETSLRIEAPVDPVDGIDLIVTTTVSDGSTLHQTTSHVAAAGHATAAAQAWGAAVAQLGDGDVVGAVSTVTQMDLSADAVATTRSTLRISDRVLGGDASLGEGVGVGLDGEAGARRLVRVG